MRTLALALDTSTPVLSAALVAWDGDGLAVLAVRTAGPPQVTSTVVPGVFDELLAEAGEKLQNVNALVAGRGPGLFTGARVAVATMKAIAYARQLPLLGAGSLEAMALAGARGASLGKGDGLSAAGIPGGSLLCPLIDARKGEVYFAFHRFEGGQLITVQEPQAVPPAALAQRLLALSEPVRLFGTGVRAMGASLPAGERFTVTPEPMTPGAAEIAFFALSRARSPAFDLHEVLALEPTYLRPPEAEVALKRRQAEQPRSGE